MYQEKLQEIVDYITHANPAFAGKGFVLTEDSDFRGITDEYSNYLYARFTETGDNTFELEEEEDACGLYRVRFEFKLVIDTKCRNQKVLYALIHQLSSICTVTSAGDNTEKIYEEETGNKLQVDDLSLYTIYGKTEMVLNTLRAVSCFDDSCINVADLC